MNSQETFLLGLVTGAGLMYVLDPERGTRRRALVRDKFVHMGHELEDAGEVAVGRARDLRNRARGVAHDARQLGRDETVDDDVLVERVRAKIGRAVTNVGAIEVGASDGRVMLSGPVLEADVEELVDTVESVRGVREVENRLDVRDSRGEVPGLQGAGE